ncbi:MAG: hypothetical protein A2087_07245 [Spirochaetes bacterium GWD1_61_31]|nr:MAG: hypothetical protein A2Y37_08230 [Spirochaetes bacterium GWB1_60_80]OHD34208.1 MAG: hypothetical protein A2004_12515 [Spirochaetes bacterium GWC1_61_12]OHD40136.1 MAG: hypothetical protein A2087_07245 [Spirochaetes bacterium GWD1_61_31]OHD45816.1 MAG: hypothetical protein A2Y35_03865 [Spirochaetes bacterium GWE1_60_18]OHD58359.1 MAG: hypothetical protein A2Y32_06255 [Spirochaetes bacterium GWF1_60_12]HAW86358.1 RNA methyltransferase [Spirochaetaceae bacterium]
MNTNRKRETAVCGRQAVRSLGDKRPDAVKRLFFTEEQAPAFGPLCAFLANHQRLYRIAEPAELERLSGSKHHQGVVAMIEDAEAPAVTAAIVAQWAAAGARIILLDKVGDDHNLGSIARSAAFFGYDGLVLCDQAGAAHLSTSAYRVARGGLEHITVYSAASARTVIELCKGQLTSVGADHRGSTDIRNFAWRYSQETASPEAPGKALLLVLGNEEKGLSMDARAACDILVRIRGAGPVESLNVSQTAAIFLYELAPGHRLQGMDQAPGWRGRPEPADRDQLPSPAKPDKPSGRGSPRPVGGHHTRPKPGQTGGPRRGPASRQPPRD